MKTKVVLTLCIVFVLGAVSHANAQLVSGSPEEQAFTKIEAERNTDAKITLMLDFEKNFPQSRVLPDVYMMLIEAYQGKNDSVKVVDFGERIIRLNNENATLVSALLTVSRNLAVERKQLDKAVQYSQKAVDTIAKLRLQPPPPQYATDADWKTYLDSVDAAAKSMLAYTRSLK
jgi:hypothetical protein